ncbi:MAG: hypothetical protein DDG58_13895 [Ardenticatenia bacterium]|nr:MAG: hypothetical protein DDG58_13895 [Ardenticatenia bacterium]
MAIICFTLLVSTWLSTPSPCSMRLRRSR